MSNYTVKVSRAGESWCTPSLDDLGCGTTRLFVSLAENTSGAARRCTVYVYRDGIEQYRRHVKQLPLSRAVGEASVESED